MLSYPIYINGFIIYVILHNFVVLLINVFYLYFTQEQEIFSQNTSKLFEEPEGPWQKMVSDLGKLGKHLISTINLSTLQGKQTRNGFKVPFLAVFVQSVDCSLPDPSVLLKDEKGIS